MTVIHRARTGSLVSEQGTDENATSEHLTRRVDGGTLIAKCQSNGLNDAIESPRLVDLPVIRVRPVQ